MKCPKCAGVFRTEKPLSVCDGCRAVWAPAGALASEMRTEHDLRATFPPREESGFRCPTGCEAELHEVVYSKTDDGLLLDQCPTCLGIYLDAGELQAVAALNRRLRELFGDGTFTGPPKKGVSWLQKLFGG